jgi:hypothetical protein
LNNKIAALSGVVGAGEFRPTNQSREAFTRLSRQLDAELAGLKRTMDTSLPALNAILRAAGLPELKPSTEEPPPGGSGHDVKAVTKIFFYLRLAFTRSAMSFPAFVARTCLDPAETTRFGR